MTKPKRKQLILFIAFSALFSAWMALFVNACGYRSVGANLTEGGERVSVPLVRNYTSFKGLAGPLTSAIRKRLAGAGLEVTKNDVKSPRLEVELFLIETEPGMLTVNNGNLDALDSIRRIHARASLVDVDGKILDGPHQFEVSGRAYAGGNPVSDEAFGHRKLKSLLDDLAQNVVAHFLSM